VDDFLGDEAGVRIRLYDAGVERVQSLNSRRRGGTGTDAS
jgi:hypothetical protein